VNATEYLAALDARLQEIGDLITSSTIQREIDANLGIGFIKGQIRFVDGSRLEFSEQLPPERRKFRLHHMDAQNNLVVRWDSAPHHKGLSTFPFHKHTPRGVEGHKAMTLIEAIDEVLAYVQKVSEEPKAEESEEITSPEVTALDVGSRDVEEPSDEHEYERDVEGMPSSRETGEGSEGAKR
jgi:hypothetical protein